MAKQTVEQRANRTPEENLEAADQALRGIYGSIGFNTLDGGRQVPNGKRKLDIPSLGIVAFVQKTPK